MMMQSRDIPKTLAFGWRGYCPTLTMALRSAVPLGVPACEMSSIRFQSEKLEACSFNYFDADDDYMVDCENVFSNYYNLDEMFPKTFG